MGGGSSGRDRAWIVATVFTATLFVSALLLFLIQPMFAKMLLPRLGGGAGVWSLALVFFQAVLLLGYVYAHLLIRFCTVRAGAMIHGAVMAAALLSLPIGIASGWDAPPEDWQPFWILGLFAASVGLPFFAVSAHAPLLQAWFARAGHARSADPYFLYAASNAGSFLALLTYPFAIEPFMGLGPQSAVWTAGYAGLIAMVVACAALTMRGPGRAEPDLEDRRRETPRLAERLRWIALALVPSGLLVSTTAHISTDIVAAPLMWVIPLALFLLTFVIAFRTRALGEGTITRLLLYGAPLAAVASAPMVTIYMLPVTLAASFMLMLACHAELARSRPAASRLTEFYMLVSLGGVMGGILASLIAPVVFSIVAEHPLLLVAAYLAVVLSRHGRACFSRRISVALSLMLAMAFAAMFISRLDDSFLALAATLWIIVLLAVLVPFRREPLAHVGFLALIIFVVHAGRFAPEASYLTQIRSFYGVHTVMTSKDGRFHDLRHGSTLHGWQMVKDEQGMPVTGRPEPQAYYHANGPFGSAIRHLRATRGNLGKVGIVGLGTGSLLCFAAPGEAWRLYEIDPDVVRIAEDPRFFTFLKDCGPADAIILGDGRLRLAAEPDESFSMIVLDAFSSDAIPAHLLTQEALDLYMAKLEPGGIAVFHLSNRYLELASVVEAAARARGFEAWTNVPSLALWSPDSERREVLPRVTVVGKTPGALPGMSKDPRWTAATNTPAVSPWTDDFSNILSAIWRELQGARGG